MSHLSILGRQYSVNEWLKYIISTFLCSTAHSRKSVQFNGEVSKLLLAIVLMENNCKPRPLAWYIFPDNSRVLVQWNLITILAVGHKKPRFPYSKRALFVLKKKRFRSTSVMFTFQSPDMYDIRVLENCNRTLHCPMYEPIWMCLLEQLLYVIIGTDAIFLPLQSPWFFRTLASVSCSVFSERWRLRRQYCNHFKRECMSSESNVHVLKNGVQCFHFIGFFGIVYRRAHVHLHNLATISTSCKPG